MLSLRVMNLRLPDPPLRPFRLRGRMPFPRTKHSQEFFSVNMSRQVINPEVQTTRLKNGAVVLTEFMPSLRSATLGIWVRRGSRHEPEPMNGILHFIEHAVFKGTARRSALDIAIESDRLGGNFDAYTTHELTGFSLKVVDKAVPSAFDLLADIVTRPEFAAPDLEREQRVIIEEMKMVEDTPDELLAELFVAAYFPDHSLGRPIEGTTDTVATFDREKTSRFHARAYAPRNLVIAAAGRIEHDEIVALAERALAHDGPVQTLVEPETNGHAPAPAAPILVQRKKELEQAHMILASPWPSARHEDRYAASMLGSIIGGGTSSRLWQRVREERGLAYSVGAASSTFTDTGVFQIYAGTSPGQLDEVLDLAMVELRRAAHETVAASELQLVKEQAISSILLALESTSARAATLARQEITHGRYIPPDDVILRIEAVTPDDIRRVANDYFTTETLAFGALGDLNGFRVNRSRLEI